MEVVVRVVKVGRGSDPIEETAAKRASAVAAITVVFVVSMTRMIPG